MPFSRVLFVLLFAAAAPSLLRAGEVARPNVLIAIADDMAWAHLSIMGCKGVNTLHIDRVARSGVLFRYGFSGAPGCSPSRAAFFTGRHVWMNEEASTHHGLFPAKFATFPDLLAQAGYATGYTGKPWSPGELGPGRTGNPAGPPFLKRWLAAHADAKAKLAAQMDAELKRTRDPRLYGANPDLADTYPNINPNNPSVAKQYPAPERR